MTMVEDRLSPEERSAILERYVTYATQAGWKVVSQTATQAQLVRGKHTSHLLHLILTIITLGIWLPVWIGISIFGGEKLKHVSVDERGSLLGI